MINPADYTNWIRSQITQDLILAAQASLMNRCHDLSSETEWQAARKALIREGGELVLNFLTTRQTIEDVERLNKAEPEMTFGADDIRQAELNPK